MKFIQRSPCPDPLAERASYTSVSDKITPQMANALPRFGPEALPYIEKLMSCMALFYSINCMSKLLLLPKKKTTSLLFLNQHLVPSITFDFSLLSSSSNNAETNFF